MIKEEIHSRGDEGVARSCNAGRWTALGSSEHFAEFGMGLKKAVVVGLAAGLVMGLSLFIVGAIASYLVYGPQFAPAGKFRPEQLNAWYFFWTKLLIGAVFGVLLTVLYELLPLSRRITGVIGGFSYAACLWLVVYLWGLSHPLVYETVSVRDEVFWLVYTLGGFLGFGGALGFAYAREARRLTRA
jgi:hypothetical protein